MIIIDAIKNLFEAIQVYLYVVIILPIKRFYNYYFKGQYIEDNMRTQALFEYLKKVIIDPSYKPQGAYEQSFENRLIECHEQVLKQIRNGEIEDVPTDIQLDYETERQSYACEILLRMNEKYVLKED